MQGRDPMKGRHNVGVQRVNTGKTRGGQSEPASNKVKTASTAFMSPKPSVLSDAADTSRDAQKLVNRPPMPFENPKGPVNLPAPSGPKGAKPGFGPKGVYAGKSGSSVGQSNPSGRAAGYSKLPNQSGQIGGRMGFPAPKRKAGSNASGYPSKKNAVFFGEN